MTDMNFRPFLESQIKYPHHKYSQILWISKYHFNIITNFMSQMMMTAPHSQSLLSESLKLYPFSVHGRYMKFFFFHIPLSVISLYRFLVAKMVWVTESTELTNREHRLNGANAFNFCFCFYFLFAWRTGKKMIQSATKTISNRILLQLDKVGKRY